MKHIKNLGEYTTDFKKYMTSLRVKLGDFIVAIKEENNETKEIFDLLLKSSRGKLLDENGKERELNEVEKKMITEQSKDIFKLIGLTSLSILPGGFIVFLLLRVFKLNDHILPSSFKKKKD